MGALGLDYGDPDFELPEEAKRKDARIAELEQAIDSAEIEHGLTSNGNLWRFWSHKAKVAVAQISVIRELSAKVAEQEALIREVVAALNTCYYAEALPDVESVTATALAKAQAAGFTP
jgi:uncharacterized coiled-coil protein SlyX